MTGESCLCHRLPGSIGSESHRADLLPLPVQLRLLVGLLEAARLPALRHLDSVLEGCPAGDKRDEDTASATNLDLIRLKSAETKAPTLAELPCCSCNLNTPPEYRSPSDPEDPFCCPETDDNLNL